VSGRSNAETAARRQRSVWRKHERGMANAEIATVLGIDESTVRYYLAKPGRDQRETTPRDNVPVVPAGSPVVVPFRRPA
jgi:FixJ family two-component response regulator